MLLALQNASSVFYESEYFRITWQRIMQRDTRKKKKNVVSSNTDIFRTQIFYTDDSENDNHVNYN